MFASEGYWIHNIPMDHGYVFLVFASTMLIYSIHRIVGIDRVSSLKHSGRFAVIRNCKNHIKVYIVLSTLGCGAALLVTDIEALKLMLPIGLISLGYVIPFLPGKRRLRDIHYVKIILIAVAWAYVATIPLLASGLHFSELWVGFLEKVIFIFLITLPFDIRDMRIDEEGGLLTIPIEIGLKNTYRICYGLLTTGILLFFLQIIGVAISTEIIISGFIIYGLTHLAIELTKNKQNDFYYSGLLDGTLVMRGIVVCMVF